MQFLNGETRQIPLTLNFQLRNQSQSSIGRAQRIGENMKYAILAMIASLSLSAMAIPVYTIQPGQSVSVSEPSTVVCTGSGSGTGQIINCLCHFAAASSYEDSTAYLDASDVNEATLACHRLAKKDGPSHVENCHVK
jgi:hypothetical protein